MNTSRDQASYAGAEFDEAWEALVVPSDYRNPEPRSSYHLIVIGAGPAGLVTAIAAAGLGARVALVERTRMGGDCLNVGCVPSKALLEYTRANPGASFADAFAWLRRVRAAIAHHDSVARYTEQGVDVFLGSAQLVDDSNVSVGDLRLSGRRIVIATGARPSVPPIPGLADCDPLTNESVFSLTQPPRSLAILGAGPIGCELAQAFARLDLRVELIEMADRVLPSELPEAAAVVGAALERAGVRLHLGVEVSSVTSDDWGVTLRTSGGEVSAERVLVAAGRRANVEDLNLDMAGVELRDGLIGVDDKLRTTNAKIYAAGDVCSRQQFTHNADAHARIVVQNALFGPTASSRRLIVPRCVYTDPEVAHVGPSRNELRDAGTPFDVFRVQFGELDRGQAEGDEDGFVEVAVRRGRDEILSATIVGHDAGEQIATLCVAMTNKLGLGAIGRTMFAYPTRSEYLRRLADSYNRTRLTPRMKRLMEIWFRLRG